MGNRKTWYRITDKQGMELGEAEGWTEADALLALCNFARIPILSLKAVHFEELA
jgi:hypothetical protein